MENSLFFKQVEENIQNRAVINSIEKIAFDNHHQIYLITAPLGAKYSYNYESNALVILSPKHKLIFLDIENDTDSFNDYCDDFIEDLNSISDKYGYKDQIGRPREWKEELTVRETYHADIDFQEILDTHRLDGTLQRKSELLISLLIGSINDIEKVGVKLPETLLDKVKKNIILFDGSD